MAHADMAEGVEHAFVGQHAAGERDLVADCRKDHAGTGISCLRLAGSRPAAKPKRSALPSQLPREPPCAQAVPRCKHGASSPCSAGPKNWRTTYESCRRSHRARHDGRGGRRAAGRERPQGAHLAHRPQRGTVARAKAARADRGRRRGDRGGRFHPLDPAAGRRGRAGAAVCAGAYGQQQQAGLRRLQRGEPADGRARRRGRSRRPARRSSTPASSARRRSRATPARASMPPARTRRALPTLKQYGLDVRVLERPPERGVGGEDVLRRHHQGHAGARRRHDAGGDARRLGRCAVRRAAGEPAADAGLAQARSGADAAEGLSLGRGDARDRRFRRRGSGRPRALCRRRAFLRADRARFRGRQERGRRARGVSEQGVVGEHQARRRRVTRSA